VCVTDDSDDDYEDDDEKKRPEVQAELEKQLTDVPFEVHKLYR